MSSQEGLRKWRKALEMQKERSEKYKKILEENNKKFVKSK